MSQIKTFDELQNYLDTAIKQGVDVVNKRAKADTFDFEKFKDITTYLNVLYKSNYDSEAKWNWTLKYLTQKDQKGNELIRFKLQNQISNYYIDLSSELTTQEKNYALLKNIEALKYFSDLSRGWYVKFKQKYSSLGDKFKSFLGFSDSDPIFTEEHNDMKKIMENWNNFKNKDILK